MVLGFGKFAGGVRYNKMGHIKEQYALMVLYLGELEKVEMAVTKRTLRWLCQIDRIEKS